MSAGDWYLTLFSLGVGLSIPVYWAGALLARRIPEVVEGSREIWFHIVAEIASAIALVASGIALLVDESATSTRLLSAVGLGMLLYSLIQSPGRFVQSGQRRMVLMFVGVWVLTIPALIIRFFFA